MCACLEESKRRNRRVAAQEGLLTYLEISLRLRENFLSRAEKIQQKMLLPDWGFTSLAGGRPRRVVSGFFDVASVLLGIKYSSLFSDLYCEFQTTFI